MLWIKRRPAHSHTTHSWFYHRAELYEPIHTNTFIRYTKFTISASFFFCGLRMKIKVITYHRFSFVYFYFLFFILAQRRVSNMRQKYLFRSLNGLFITLPTDKRELLIFILMNVQHLSHFDTFFNSHEQ